MFCLATALLADQTSFAKSGVVTINGQKIIKDSKIGKQINDELMAEKDKLAKPLLADEQHIMQKDQQLQKNKQDLDKEASEVTTSTLLSDEAKQRKIEGLQEKARLLEKDKAELELLVKQIQQDAKRLESKMQQMYQEKMGKFDAKIKEVIKSIAATEGWDVVLMEEQVVYAGPSVSKTDVIIAKLDGDSSSKASGLEKELKKDEKELKQLKAKL